jgi:hypothetical protein
MAVGNALLELQQGASFVNYVGALQTFVRAPREVVMALDPLVVLHAARDYPRTPSSSILIAELAVKMAPVGNTWLPFLLGIIDFIRPSSVGWEGVRVAEAILVYARQVGGRGDVNCLRAITRTITPPLSASAAIVALLFDAAEALRDLNEPLFDSFCRQLLRASSVINAPPLMERLFTSFRNVHGGAVGPYETYIICGYIRPDITYRLRNDLTENFLKFMAKACVVRVETVVPQEELSLLLETVFFIVSATTRNSLAVPILARSRQLRRAWTESYKLIPWPFDELPPVKRPPRKPSWELPVFPPTTQKKGWPIEANLLKREIKVIVSFVQKEEPHTPPQYLHMKVGNTIAQLILNVFLFSLHSIRPLGDLDEIVLHTLLGIGPGDIRLSRKDHLKAIRKFPNLFPSISQWRVEVPGDQTMTLDAPLMVFYHSREAASDDKPPLVATFDAVRHCIHFKRAPVDLATPPAKFLTALMMQRITAAGPRDPAAVRALRTALFAILLDDIFELIRPAGHFNSFIREFTAYVNCDLRLLSAVIQSCHFRGAFWSLGVANQLNITTPSFTRRQIFINDSLGDMWHVIQSFGRESAMIDFRLLRREESFAEFFLWSVVTNLSGGLPIIGKKTIDVNYLPHLGWLCAYLLFVRTSYPLFGPSVYLGINFFDVVIGAALEGFKAGFDIVLNFDLVTSLIQLDELNLLLHK